jgi:hypothetical protein
MSCTRLLFPQFSHSARLGSVHMYQFHISDVSVPYQCRVSTVSVPSVRCPTQKRRHMYFK